MRFSEEQIRDVVALKEDLIGRIEKHQESIEVLEKNLAVLDLVLKESSFTKASQLGKNKAEIPEKESPDSSIPITRGGDGKVIANALVTPDRVSIVVADWVEIDADTPPFKSFFLDRIIGEMKRKDSLEAGDGKNQKESVIDCTVNKSGSDIREIVITNYGQKERVNEIISTVGWSLTRMLENVSK